MAKELNHRANELQDLGWAQHEITRYIELWDYRQRWGAINLEREDRYFLRKAESALPIIKTGKPSVKKLITEKSYYKRILSFLQAMNLAESTFSISKGSRGLWPLILEEELRTLVYFQPVLGLPDTLKAKKLIPFREEIISTAIDKYQGDIQNFNFDFSSLLNESNKDVDQKWKPLRDLSSNAVDHYPVLNEQNISAFRKEVRAKIILIIKSTFPSLADTDMPDPPDDWISESIS